MWPGLVGKGGPGAEPPIDLDTMLDHTAKAEVNGRKFDGVDLFLFDPHVSIDSTDDDLQIEEGALYTALHRMEKRGWIESEWGLSDTGRRAKFYQLTRAGRQQLQLQTQRWTRYASAVFKVLQTA